ncbi:hypothetical protein MtrunA17_Chr2g0331101 [Medicago truncatula]|uniref:Avr9/Cf-9 rapidly elicited protein n=1 Tax=Medicago truncatula TaxID=3880 RepID=G7II07_MEDTR|nr:uncharacterized protein LOC11433447 [Medicago truncatula]AES67936.1 Avr9/Cf-9 rapidly elicited protein [Medicago truncatula]RHN76350.1 hypothetical protein MtrunA17_Chr2g0331101 [Medicago truncatula]
MENNLPVISKRVWSMVRVAFFMLRKGISKGKLMMGLNMMLKRRSKLAGKAIANLMFHHHSHHSSSSSRSHDSRHQFTASREYEFSCSNTPHHFFPIGKRHRSNNHNHNNFFTCAHTPPTQDDDVATMSAMKAVLEMLNNDQAIVEASPALPGFGRSPMVRQLRVTDSPFPLREDDEKDNQVDKAAEDFINRFYSQLRKQD